MFSIGYLDFDISHTNTTVVNQEILGNYESKITIEPGKYMVTFNNPIKAPMHIFYYLKDGSYLWRYNTADGISNSEQLSLVTHEIDFSNINTNVAFDYSYSVHIFLYEDFPGTITFEPID